MTAHSSDRGGRGRAARTPHERGAVLALVVVALFVLLASAGLAVDLGRGYLTKVRIARAVDAAALAGARSLRLGAAEEEAEAVFRANLADVTPIITFGTNERGEDTVEVSAGTTIDTTFMRIAGIDTMDVAADGIAAVPPLDIVLVVDISRSMCLADSWDDLQDAATQFVEYFDDDLDQIGLVSFQIVAEDLFELDQPFRSAVSDEIEDLETAGDTNVQEGLRRARQQITGPSARDIAAKVVVFFTDGRPTAMRGNFSGRDRIMVDRAGGGSSPLILFDDPDGIPHDEIPVHNGASIWPCPGGGVEKYWPYSCYSSWCSGYSMNAARTEMADRGLEQAEAIREEDVYIYSIGLGNFDSPDADPPDLDYLCQIANTDEIANPSEDAEDCTASTSTAEPQGKVYFAPTSAELEAVFNDVARDLIVRLAS